MITMWLPHLQVFLPVILHADHGARNWEVIQMTLRKVMNVVRPSSEQFRKKKKKKPFCYRAFPRLCCAA